MTTERDEGAEPPRSRPIESPRGQPKSADAPRSSGRRRPTAYRVIFEPRKSGAHDAAATGPKSRRSAGAPSVRGPRSSRGGPRSQQVAPDKLAVTIASIKTVKKPKPADTPAEAPRASYTAGDVLAERYRLLS